MPTVPLYNRPQVQQGAMSSAKFTENAPIEAFGGGQATQAVAGAAANMLGEFAKAKKSADQLAVLSAEQELAKYETELLYNPQSGAVNKRGEQVFGLPQEVNSSYQKKVDELRSKLSGADQQNLFMSRAGTRAVDIDRQLQRHVSAEITKYDDQVTTSFVANERNAAAANYHDPERIGLSITRQQKALNDYAVRNGLPEEWVQEKTLEAQSQTNLGVVKQMLSGGEYLYAKKYFEENKDSFNAKDLATAQGMVKEGSIRAESQMNAGNIMSKNLSMSQALAEARKIQDPDIQQATVAEVKTRYGELEAIEREENEDRFKKAAEFAEINKARPSEDVWLNMSLQERNAIDSRIQQLRQGIQPETNWDDYYTLKTLASSPTSREEFLKTNLLIYRPKMANAEFKELINLQTQLRKDASSGDKLLDGFRSDQQIVNDTLTAAGIKVNAKPGTKESEKVNLFRRRVDEEVMAFQQKTGRKVNNEDLQGIVDNLMVEGITKKRTFWFDEKKKAFELQPGESFEVERVEQIPRGELAKITDALKRRNMPVTDQQILMLYLQKIQGSARGN